MPEGPSIVLLREAAQRFEGQTVQAVEGNTRIDKARLLGRTVRAVRSWGKHFLMDFGDDLSLRVHFLLFGSWRIDERKDSVPRLALRLDDGEINFYTCSVRFIEGPLADTYDWRRDLLSDQWDPKLAARTLRDMPHALLCDILLDQDVFAGSGNIIKNEVLFRIRVHPLSTVGALPARKRTELIAQARQYSFDFLEWKRQHVLKQHWLAHTKSTCPRCLIPLRRGHLGRTKRRSFWCERCQLHYGTGTELAAEPGQDSPQPSMEGDDHA